MFQQEKTEETPLKMLAKVVVQGNEKKNILDSKESVISLRDALKKQTKEVFGKLDEKQRKSVEAAHKHYIG